LVFLNLKKCSLFCSLYYAISYHKASDTFRNAGRNAIFGTLEKPIWFTRILCLKVLGELGYDLAERTAELLSTLRNLNQVILAEGNTR
jgi:hypothetical protein